MLTLVINNGLFTACVNLSFMYINYSTMIFLFVKVDHFIFKKKKLTDHVFGKPFNFIL